MTYEGYEVMPIHPNRAGSIQEVFNRKVAVLDPRTGKRWSDEEAPAPSPSRPFTWTAIGRTEIAAMRAFLEALKGMAVPFWLPSWQWDLQLSLDILQADTLVTLKWVRYQEQMFGTTGARRHLALWEHGQVAMDIYHVDDATDPRDGVVETITIDPAATRLYPKDSTVISFLKLCRLEDDAFETTYYASSAAAETVVRCRELPLEAPL